MGCRRHISSGEEELRGQSRASARCSSISQRRTLLWFWCGVVFLGAAVSCQTATHDTTPEPVVLTVGFPEAGAAGVELGLGQLLNVFTQEGLTQVNLGVDGRAVPRLAESWSWENDGLRLRLRLRGDVLFHDGTKLTSSVAAEALKRAIEQPANRARYPSLSDISEVHPDTELELVIELERPSALLPEELDLPLGIGPDNIGTGAFRLVRQNSEGALLERFDRYYLGVPQIRQIVIRPFDTLRTTWTSLLRSEVDMSTDVPPEALEFVQSDDIQTISFPRNYQFLIAFNSRKPPFTSALVRRALNSAVDRNRLIASVLRNGGQPATGPLWPQHWAYDASVQPYGFDPRATVSLLESAGFQLSAATGSRPPARLRFVCLLPDNFSLQERIGLEVQKQLYDVGVDMQFEVVPIEEYNQRIRSGQFDAVLMDAISGPTFGRPFIFWRSAREFKGLNMFGYENPEAERLFQILRTSTNEAAVRSAVSRLQRTLLEDPPALFLIWNQRTRAVSRRFRVENSGRDPLFTIWQWTENTDRRPVSTQ
jgi:peptide/nickel transport system substrate-binding protein